MSSDVQLADYYARRAEEYERIYEKPERQADLEELRSMVETAFAGAHVFEVACGTGYWTRVLARSAASVFATDLNEEVLARARAKGMDAGKVTFRRIDAYELNSVDGKLDAGFSAFWWSHVPRRRIRQFLTGFHRALSPGAQVTFIDNVYVEGSSTPISAKDELGDTYQVRRLQDGSTYQVLKNFPTADELLETVAGLGQRPQVQFLHFYWVLKYTL